MHYSTSCCLNLQVVVHCCLMCAGRGRGGPYPDRRPDGMPYDRYTGPPPPAIGDSYSGPPPPHMDDRYVGPDGPGGYRGGFRGRGWGRGRGRGRGGESFTIKLYIHNIR